MIQVSDHHFLVAGKDFMNAPWLFAEAYKYRRLHECFSVSKFWKDYDVFYRQKVRTRFRSNWSHPSLTSVSFQNDTFSRSSQAVFELASRFAKPYQPSRAGPGGERLMFLELTQGSRLPFTKL